MNEQLLNSLYGLRTHPFAPTVDETGTLLGRDIFASPLNPQVDQRFLSYYFDVYDWTRFGATSGLQALVEAAQSKRAADLVQSGGPASMLLISGFDNSGRESLLNLFLRVLGIQHPGIAPLKVDLADVSNDGNVLTVAQMFMVSYKLAPPAPPKTEISDTFKDLTKIPVTGSETAYHNLFQAWNAMISIAQPTPLYALILRGKVGRDTWRVIYNSASTLFSIFIVLTDQDDYAEGCFHALSRQGRSVAIVKAQFLDKIRTVAYVRWCLRRERETANIQDPLLPFTEDAINALFEKGSRSDTSTTVTFPVGFVNKTLRRALDDKLAQNPPPEQSLIRAEEIRAARNALNFGK